MIEAIPLEELEKGRAYRLKSRNLYAGVWNGKNGYIGIREKFGSFYLFTEYDWREPHHGTAWPLEALDMMPPWIILREGNTLCDCNSMDIFYVRYFEPIFKYHYKTELNEGDVTIPGQWVCLDCTDPHPAFHNNKALHNWLEQYELEERGSQWLP